ncbi:MAG: DUF6481 family protein [Croceibacterium sp.]
MAYKQPDFNERANLSRQARQKALDQLRDKPAPTEAELAELAAARVAHDAKVEAQRAERAAKKLAREQERAAAAEAKALAHAAKQKPVETEAEKKARRDARYAARKKR